jgi:hypothetical protein
MYFGYSEDFSLALFFLKKCWPSTWHEASYG